MSSNHAPPSSPLSFEEFEARCVPEAEAVEDRSLRYVSSPCEHDLALETAWPLLLLQLEISRNG